MRFVSGNTGNIFYIHCSALMPNINMGDFYESSQEEGLIVISGSLLSQSNCVMVTKESLGIHGILNGSFLRACSLQ